MPFRAAVKTFVRRCVSITVYAYAASFLCAFFPCALCVLGCVDVLKHHKGHWPWVRAYAVLVWYALCEVFGVVAACMLWVLKVCGVYGHKQAYMQANAALQRCWSEVLFRGVCAVYGMRLNIEDTARCNEAPFLLFVRHTSVADTLLAAVCVANPHRLVLRYVLKDALLWDPCLDIVGHRLPNAFIDRSKNNREANVEALVSLLQGLDARSAVLLYPEGTRFSAQKLQQAQALWAQKKEDPLSETVQTYRHVLPPRMAGPMALLSNAPGLDVVVLEHVGFEDVTTLAQCWQGALVGRTIHVRLRRIKRESIDEKNEAQWLFKTWAEVDSWVESTRV